MATFLDVGLLEFFLPVFSFIFVLVLTFAILDKANILSGNKYINWALALGVAVLTLFSGATLNLINIVVPWFVILFVFISLLFAIFMFLGSKPDDLWKEIGGKGTIVIVSILLLAIAIGQAFGPIFSPYGDGGDGQSIRSETIRTIFHPRVLGAMFIIVVAAYATKYLSKAYSDV